MEEATWTRSHSRGHGEVRQLWGGGGSTLLPGEGRCRAQGEGLLIVFSELTR